MRETVAFIACTKKNYDLAMHNISKLSQMEIATTMIALRKYASLLLEEARSRDVSTDE